QIPQEVLVVLAKLLNLRLLCGIILRADDLVHPPFVAGSRAQHASHQMIMSVCMSKCMEGIVAVHTEILAGDKDRSAGSQGNIAHSVADRSGSYCGCSVVSCSGYYF